ncbi:MAG TPA: Uma2 family endonuclease [Urbifossiella sp.]|nr:Uma2 family endonuclease [Urbifossiella sp.]
MSAVASASRIFTLADVLRRVGDIPLERVLVSPAPGTAKPEDAVNPAIVGDRLVELVGGILVEKAVGFYGDLIGTRLIHILSTHLDQNNVGATTGAQGGYRFAFDLMRMPDVAFVRWDSVDDTDEIEDPDGAFLETAPDLVVEVLSPGNTKKEMAIKLGEYAKAGVRLVWYVDPERKAVDVFPKARAKGKVTVGIDGTLDGGSVLPGFTLPVAKLFEKRAPAGRKGGKAPKGKPKKG